MPTKAGTVEFPELQLNWWDTEAGVERTAILPKWTVDVLPGKGLPAETVVQPAESDEPGTEANGLQDTAEVKIDDASSTRQESSLVGKIREYWLTFLLFAIAVIMVVYWIRRKNHPKNPELSAAAIEIGEPSAANKQTQRELKQKLQKACSVNDAQSTARILLEMAAIARPQAPPKTLPSLAAILEHGSEEIINLDRHMYASAGVEWNGDNFYQSFKEGLAFKAAKKDGHEVLAPLYPD
jgi:hypothetical protein